MQINTFLKTILGKGKPKVNYFHGISPLVQINTFLKTLLGVGKPKDGSVHGTFSYR